MKQLSRTSKIATAVLGCAILISCNKGAGEGGTSSISGEVLSTDHDFARQEITSVYISNGNTVEHGDYWLLNHPNAGLYFYIWYDNPTWITNGDPSLQGRTGIQVVFNYSDSNLDIAQNTKAAIEAATTAFSIEQTNDILTITSLEAGDSPDAESVTSPFSIDIAQQGQDEVWGTESAQQNEKVYIIYGSGDSHDDIEQTSLNGKFQFTNLRKGTYSVYVFSKDTVAGGSIAIEQQIEITENGTNYNLDPFQIYF